jgi:hypothetical protein
MHSVRSTDGGDTDSDGRTCRIEPSRDGGVLSAMLSEPATLAESANGMVLDLDAVAHAITFDQAVKIVVALGPCDAADRAHFLLQDAEADVGNTGIGEELALNAERAGKIRLREFGDQAEGFVDLSARVAMPARPIEIRDMMLRACRLEIDSAVLTPANVPILTLVSLWRLFRGFRRRIWCR